MSAPPPHGGLPRVHFNPQGLAFEAMLPSQPALKPPAHAKHGPALTHLDAMALPGTQHQQQFQPQMHQLSQPRGAPTQRPLYGAGPAPQLQQYAFALAGLTHAHQLDVGGQPMPGLGAQNGAGGLQPQQAFTLQPYTLNPGMQLQLPQANVPQRPGGPLMGMQMPGLDMAYDRGANLYDMVQGHGGQPGGQWMEEQGSRLMLQPTAASQPPEGRTPIHLQLPQGHGAPQYAQQQQQQQQQQQHQQHQQFLQKRQPKGAARVAPSPQHPHPQHQQQQQQQQFAVRVGDSYPSRLPNDLPFEAMLQGNSGLHPFVHPSAYGPGPAAAPTVAVYAAGGRPDPHGGGPGDFSSSSSFGTPGLGLALQMQAMPHGGGHQMDDEGGVEFTKEAMQEMNASQRQKTINQKLVRTTLQTNVIELVEDIGVEQMSAINVSIAFGRLAKRAGNPASQPQLKKVITQLSQRTITLIDQLYGRQIAAIGHAFAKLHIHHKPLTDALMERAVLPHVISTFNSQDIGNLTWAFASLGIRNVAFMKSMAQWATEPAILSKFNTQELANTAWAYATLNVECPALMEGIAEATISQKFLLNAQDIANISWAYATLGILHEELMKTLANIGCTPQVLQTFTSQGIANTVWAYATLEVVHQPFIDALAERAQQPTILKTFKYSSGLAKTTWGFAILKRSGCEGLMAALADRAMGGVIFKCNSQNLATIAWAYAIQGIHLPQLMESFANKAFDIISTFSAQSIATMAWAWATLKVQRLDLMEALAAQALGEDVLAAFTPLDIANTVWGFASLGVLNARLMEALAERAVQPSVLPHFGFQSISNTVWGYAVLGVPEKALMDGLADRAMALEEGLDFQVAANVAWAYATLGFLRWDMVASMFDRMVLEEELQHAGAQDIANAVWALATIGSPGAGMMEQFIPRLCEAEVVACLSAQDISNVSWAYATTGVLSQPLMERLANRMLQPDTLASCSQTDASQLIWAYAVLGCVNLELMNAMARKVPFQEGGFNAEVMDLEAWQQLSAA
eukprot:EG_transcript_1841